MEIQGVIDLFPERLEKGVAVISNYEFDNHKDPLYNLRSIRDDDGLMYMYDGKKKIKEGFSKQYSDFVYKVGEIVIPDSFDPSPLIECSHGISAFITKQEAIDY